VQEEVDTDALGLGPLDVASAQQLVGLASCLIRRSPEQAQPDMPAQRLLASMQVRLDRLNWDAS
jgi:predicted N-acetyltransferase YhbS